MTMNEQGREKRTEPGLTRRGVLGGLTVLFSGLPLAEQALADLESATDFPDRDGRVEQLVDVRLRAAEAVRRRGRVELSANGDTEEVPHHAACYSKGLPHDELGHVDPKAFELLLRALETGRHDDFESIPLGGPVRLANPQAALAFDLLGPDGCQLELAPAPRMGSAEQAAELIELYWRSLARDIPFAEYSEHRVTREAAAEIAALSAQTGPPVDASIPGETLFRGELAGCLRGPLVSQFLWKPVPWTPVWVEQVIRTAAPRLDYMTEYPAWLEVQNGQVAGANRFDPKRRYIRNGRDLGEYVHRDVAYQAFLGACHMALRMGAPIDEGNPYKHSHTQTGFGTFGAPYLVYLLAVVTQVALKVSWFQKWVVHRRLRPEKLAGRVENHLAGRASYPLHEELLESRALAEIRRRHGTALLPQAYPEGSPTHPSYPAAHAVIAGACATVLKACFDESYPIPDPVVATADGLALDPYRGPALTLGGELDKLATNIAYGRDFAGVHYRSDGAEGLKLGEAVTVAVLEELQLTGNELFTGFSLRRFDGGRVRIGSGAERP